jgi:hypothetical protein
MDSNSTNSNNLFAFAHLDRISMCTPKFPGKKTGRVVGGNHLIRASGGVCVCERASGW